MLFIKKVAKETSLWNRLSCCQTALVMFACVCPKIRFINIEPLSKLVFGAANIFFITAVTLQHINHTFCIAMKGPRKYFECPRIICIGKSIPLSYQRTDLAISSTVTFKGSPFHQLLLQWLQFCPNQIILETFCFPKRYKDLSLKRFLCSVSTKRIF